MFTRMLDSHYNESEGRFGMQAPCCPLVGSATFPLFILLSMHAKAHLPQLKKMPSHREVHLVSLQTPRPGRLLQSHPKYVRIWEETQSTPVAKI